MPSLTNYHVTDLTNIGDLLSSPLRYFDFPGFDCQTLDIGKVDADNVVDSNIIIGGGGLLFERFLPHIQDIYRTQINKNHINKIILWGVGQQRYGAASRKPESFDYAPFVQKSHLVGIRDDGMDYIWVPCASCMHPAFDKLRKPEYEVVVFSHKKFQIDFPDMPKMTNLADDFEAVIDFLGSGETIITSSFHGAYWGTLLGRKVIAFPFSSKFFTLRHQPTLYPVKKWSRVRWKLSVFGRVLYSIEHEGDKLTCDTQDWQQYLKEARAYPESLQECRDSNIQFYQRVMDILNN